MEALVAAMRAHPQSLMLQRRGCGALRSLCSGEGFQLCADRAAEAVGFTVEVSCKGWWTGEIDSFVTKSNF